MNPAGLWLQIGYQTTSEGEAHYLNLLMHQSLQRALIHQ